jgi:hypothetical protein
VNMNMDNPNEGNSLNGLRYLMQGQTAPVTAQLMYYAYDILAPEVAKHPGSREYKQALRELYADLGLPIALTRKDIAHGFRFLAANRLLPEWVITDGFGGAQNGNV